MPDLATHRHLGLRSLVRLCCSAFQTERAASAGTITDPGSPIVWLLSECDLARHPFPQPSSELSGLFREFPGNYSIRARFAGVRRWSLRNAGFNKPFDKHVAMRKAAQIAAQEANVDGRADAVARLNKELRLL